MEIVHMVKLSKFAMKCKVCGVKLPTDQTWCCDKCKRVLQQIDEAHTLGDCCMVRDPEHESRIERYAQIVESGKRIFE